MKDIRKKVIRHEGKQYKLIVDQFGHYDIYDGEKKFATHIGANYIGYTIDLYQLGCWCDECDGTGILEHEDGSVVVCRECSN